MKARRVAIPLAVVMTFTHHVHAAQHEGHQTAAQTAAAPDAALVTACVASQQHAAAVADRLNRQLEIARQANAPMDMRIAMDGLQAGLVEMRTTLKACDPLRAAADRMEPMARHNMAVTQQAPVGTARMPAMDPGSTRPAPAAAGANAASAAPMTGMDHSKMAMSGTTAARKRSTGAATKPTPAAPMDHSRMAMGGGTTATKPSAGPATKPTPAGPMDHSKGATGGGEPEAGGDRGSVKMHGPKLPVVPVERIADPACPDTVNQANAPTATYQRKVYYFCSTADRDRFRKDPGAYLKKQPR